MTSAQQKLSRTSMQQPGEWNPAQTEDFLDATTFEQLLEMDDDEEREFSKGIVWNYFEQVKSSFAPIEEGMLVPPWQFDGYADPFVLVRSGISKPCLLSATSSRALPLRLG